jgi:hypothetical protein
MILSPLATLAPVTLMLGAWIQEGQLSGESVAVSVHPPSVGQSRTVEVHESHELDVNVKVGEQSMPGGNNKGTTNLKRTEVIMAVADGQVTKVEISFDSGKVQFVTPLGDQEIPVPVIGKTYWAEQVADGIKITDAKGQAVTEEEESQVRSVAKLTMGKPLFAEHLGSGLQVGKTIKIPVAALSRLFDGDKVVSGGDMTLTLKKTEADGSHTVGVFTAAINLQEEITQAQPMPMKGQVKKTLSGEIHIQLDGCLLRKVTLQGPMNLTGVMEGAGFKAETAGTGKLTRSIVLGS